MKNLKTLPRTVRSLVAMVEGRRKSNRSQRCQRTTVPVRNPLESAAAGMHARSGLGTAATLPAAISSRSSEQAQTSLGEVQLATLTHRAWLNELFGSPIP